MFWDIEMIQVMEKNEHIKKLLNLLTQPSSKTLLITHFSVMYADKIYGPK